jgi:hypothetical protein
MPVLTHITAGFLPVTVYDLLCFLFIFFRLLGQPYKTAVLVWPMFSAEFSP